MKPTIVLLDIDGTLLTSGGAGRRAMESAFARFGKDACAFSFAGMTDRAIVRRGLMSLGEAVDDAAIDRVLEAYLGALEIEVARSEAKLCHGVAEALGALESARHVALGLGTGNVRRGARLKVSRVTEFDRFAFGGFGCDHEDRAELLRIGASRGAERLGVAASACNVVVIGDTPRDIAAAKAIGAASIAVATGPFTIEELAKSEPTSVVAHLAEAGALGSIVGETG